MIEKLKKNIDTEIGILREIASYTNSMESAGPAEKKLLKDSIESLRQRMIIINNSIPSILLNISSIKKLPGKVKPSNLENVKIKSREGEKIITLNKEDKEKFLREAMLNERLLKKINREKEKKQEIYTGFQTARGYLKYSNKFFLKTAKKIISKGYFRPLSRELKRANINILFETYVALIFFSVLLSFFASLCFIILITIFDFSLSLPFITLQSGGYFSTIAMWIWLPIVLPLLTFFMLYYYPSTERKVYANRIEQELPFAVIYMSAISGSGIEPTQIFKIIAESREYPYLKREMRKVLNQINIYGYDLVTSLNNVAKVSPSASLSELLSGISTTINTGGSLSEFFGKRSQTLLLNYRLKRESYTKLAETFMDIYISVVIATPMILMLLLIVLTISAPDLGINPNMLTLIIVSAVSMTNIFFLIFLQLKQPSY